MRRVLLPGPALRSMNALNVVAQTALAPTFFVVRRYQVAATCGCCGVVHDRDVAAARNILRLGRQALAEGSSALSA